MCLAPEQKGISCIFLVTSQNNPLKHIITSHFTREAAKAQSHEVTCSNRTAVSGRVGLGTQKVSPRAFTTYTGKGHCVRLCGMVSLKGFRLSSISIRKATAHLLENGGVNTCLTSRQDRLGDPCGKTKMGHVDPQHLIE